MKVDLSGGKRDDRGIEEASLSFDHFDDRISKLYNACPDLYEGCVNKQRGSPRWVTVSLGGTEYAEQVSKPGN
ncbi:hypothetical protein KM043_010050 [Ampulex compressa]|nr:hypothetical protein KM043_010050 [Ampulex compressa]